MGNHGCVNGSLHGVDYTLATPIIGIYAAVASLACLALMLHDIVVAGIYARKRWLPCMYFKLDSLSLTLLGVVTTLPLDLTTSMPSTRDQLSKLTGTATICIFMGFLAPSLGVNEESECFTNMIALSIFIATVGIYMCIQLYTGVIVMFRVENIVMLCFMLLLLLMLWHVCFWIKVQKRIDKDRYNNLLSKGSDSMFERLKLSSLYAYCSNPQYKISMYPMSAAINTICLGCAVVIVETLRSLVLKKVEFCGGNSDYRWSVWYIVITQIVTVIVGAVAIVVRWFALFSRMDLESIYVPFLPDEDHVIQKNQTLASKGITLYRILHFFGYLATKFVLIAQVVILSPQLLVCYLLGVKKEDNKLEYFGEELIAASGYIVRKSLDGMIRLMNKVNKSESLYLPSKYLCQHPHSLYLHFRSMKIKDGIHQIEVSSLTIALLVKIAQASIPKDRLENVLSTFAEAKEVVQFIDKIIQPKSTEMNEKLAYARAVWRGGDLTCLLPGHTQPGIDHTAAVDTIETLKKTLHSGDIWYDLRVLVNFINRKSYSSMDELCRAIEQLFADMLHALYAQLPNAIFKCLRATPAEAFEESIGVAMEFMFRIGSLDCQNFWVFPADMSCIINDEALEYTGFLKRLEEVVLVRGGDDFEIIEEAHMLSSVPLVVSPS